MAHELDFSTGRAGIAYVGARPWHGFGQILTPGADLDVWQREAGLQWVANRSPVLFDAAPTIADQSLPLSESPYILPMTDRVVLWRSDTQAPLSVVSSGYRIVQPGEALEFFRDFLAAGDMTMESAGSLDGGRRIWGLARVGEDFRLMGQDSVEGYLLLATSFDGSMATTAKFTTVRVVCQNTLHMADRLGGQPTVRVGHNAKFNPASVKAALGVTAGAWSGFQEMASALAARRVNPIEARSWLIEVFGDPSKTIEDQAVADQRLMSKVWESVTSSPGSNLRSAEGTAWGLLNGASHYFDHARKYRTDNARLSDNWFGAAAQVKQRALSALLKLAA